MAIIVTIAKRIGGGEGKFLLVTNPIKKNKPARKIIVGISMLFLPDKVFSDDLFIIGGLSISLFIIPQKGHL